jgi:FeS assembly SUF system regulator
MFKINKLTDYGVVILRYLAGNGKSAMPLSARDIAQLSGLPLPTVSKILKLMAKHRLVMAKRGAFGGYELLVSLCSISILRLVEIFEGPPARTACMTGGLNTCQIETSCPERGRWQLVHEKVAEVLDQITLSEIMANKELSPKMSSRSLNV